MSRDVEAGHLGLVTNQEAAIGNGGVGSGLAPPWGESGGFCGLGGCCFDPSRRPGVGRDDQVTACKDHLAVAVAAALPFSVASFDINAGENPLVQSVNISLVQD